MSVTYYLARPDSATLFDMDRAFGLVGHLATYGVLDIGAAIDLDALTLALMDWYGDKRLAEATDLDAEIRTFADERDVWLIAEHHEWLDEPKWRSDGRLRVVGWRA